ncbi:MAG: hypothetical protein K9N51_10555 [Candidatus Pacebacteria bacterium]|nr:hypothetical protein [Candidatus Paceibacterota bacterium]
MTTQSSPKIGLLPLYLKLYDDIRPECRAEFDGFIQEIVGEFTAHGITAELGSVCRVAHEFEAAVRQFEASGIDCIVTLHLAYSPSLEAIDALCRTSLPIVLLDTTMDADFGLGVSADRIMYNHGVHGVMDLASMLRRRGRSFEIVAGHLSDGRLMDRAAGLVRAACAARQFKSSHILRLGEAFAGMGDFSVPEDVLADTLGLCVDQVALTTLDNAIQTISDQDVANEMAADREHYRCELTEDVHARSVRVGLGLRRLLEQGDYHGMSVNFQGFDRTDRPADTMPFLEISKAMARGIGYAGEGDVLTAALVGALARSFGAVTFTEIFCTDWAGDRLFLSHMGEISPAVARGTPRMFAKPSFDGKSLDPAVLTCSVKPGPAVFVNLAPGPDDGFSLIVAPVVVLAEEESIDSAMRDTVRAWIRPRPPVTEFLEEYSRAGGTHHSALVLGEAATAIAAFGTFSGMEIVPFG